MTVTSDSALPASLNAAQREAVLHHQGPILVLAGAGSGKTRVLTSRIAWLVQHHGVDPRQILAVTFTNKAAGEMRERVERLLGEAPRGMWVGTFHAIGARLLRRDADRVGRTPSFTIYDEEDSLGTVRRVMERLGISPKTWSPKVIRSLISDAKNSLVPPDEYASLAMDPLTRHAAAVYAELEGALRDRNAADFDDLLVLPVRILRENPDRLAAYRQQFRFILVDEYQDTNRAQYQLIKLLGGEHGNVCVVGDDDQSIYGWRGADIRNILDFEKDFPKARIVRLEENYRSTPPILEVANAVISANTERRGKTLRATRHGGDKVAVVRCLDERDEADWVADEILARRGLQRDLALRDVAILYRTNAQSRAMEEAMRKRALPYRLIGAVRFYDRREIRDLMGYLKLIANPSDDEAFLRAVAVPRRGLGDVALEQLAEIARAARVPMLAAAARPELLGAMRPAARQALGDFAALVGRFRVSATEASVDELLRDLVEAIRYVDHLRAEGPEGVERIENVRELITSAAETVADEGGEVGLTPLDHFLQRATLVAGVDALDPSADAIAMMTMHNAKGLEFPLVFLTGLEDGLFPLAHAYEQPHLLEEERRLFYVGITRAERKLYITHAESRRRNGETMQTRPSGFLSDIPEGLIEQQRTIKLRSSGRAFMSGGGYGGARRGSAAERGGGRGGWRDALGGGGRDYAELDEPVRSPGQRRPGKPVTLGAWAADDVDASQDAAVIAPGARVRHAKFGGGTIAEVTGTGRDAKVKVDFDDEAIGRKTLVVAQAKLEREWD